jgi:hypothetical protein
MEPGAPLQLDAATIDAVARRVVELLVAAEPRWVDAAEVARRFGVARSWVYAHAPRLGAVRLGHGPRARLRFDPQLVARALAEAPSVPERDPAPTPPRRSPGPNRATLAAPPGPSTIPTVDVTGRSRHATDQQFPTGQE